MKTVITIVALLLGLLSIAGISFVLSVALFQIAGDFPFAGVALVPLILTGVIACQSFSGAKQRL